MFKKSHVQLRRTPSVVGMLIMLVTLSLQIVASEQNLIIIKMYQASLHKQAVKKIIEDNWDMLFGGYVHGYREPLVDDLLDTGCNCIKVICCDDEVVGFLEYSQRNENRAHIELLGIHKNYQGKGLGTQLLQDAFNFLQTLGIRCITIDTMFDNLTARGLYEDKFGFIPLYIKLYNNSELGKESLPVLSLGRAMQGVQWDDTMKTEVMIADEIAADIDEYRIIEKY